MPATYSSNTIKGFETQEAKDKLFDDIKNIVETNRNSAGATIKILQKTQELCGYLALPVLELLAEELRTSLSHLYNILTFYHYFTIVPKGKYVIQVCKGTACYVKGGQNILDSLKKNFDLVPGGISKDKKYSLEMVRCLGCCGLSPVIAVGNDIYRKVKPGNLKEILNSYK
jgi:NADH:ubiquinone oxidoreductase subunit E